MVNLSCSAKLRVRKTWFRDKRTGCTQNTHHGLKLLSKLAIASFAIYSVTHTYLS